MQERQPPPDRGARLDWADLPRRVRSEVERWLGGRVLSAVTQPTGFSPGVAARLTTDDGRRVFAKAVGPEPNADAPAFHRREIAIASSLPDSTPSPRLLWSYDEADRGWVLLIFEDVDGHHPAQPWRLDELDRVVTAMEQLAETDETPYGGGFCSVAAQRLPQGMEKLDSVRWPIAEPSPSDDVFLGHKAPVT